MKTDKCSKEFIKSITLYTQKFFFQEHILNKKQNNSFSHKINFKNKKKIFYLLKILKKDLLNKRQKRKFKESKIFEIKDSKSYFNYKRKLISIKILFKKS